MVAIFVVASISSMIVFSSNADFSIAAFEKGKYIGEVEETKEASSITIDKVDYLFNEENQEIVSLKGAISLNATVFAGKEIETVAFSTSQPNVTLRSPAEDYSADLNEVILKGRKSIVFSDFGAVSYSRIGVIIQSDEKNSVQHDEVTDDDVTLCLIDSLKPRFLTVDVTFPDGSRSKKFYSLGTFVDNDGKLEITIFESDGS